VSSSNGASSMNPPSGPGLPLINDTVSFAGRGDGGSSSSYPYASASAPAPCPLALAAAAALTWLVSAPRHRLRL
jgi:hypothetical protein